MRFTLLFCLLGLCWGCTPRHSAVKILEAQGELYVPVNPASLQSLDAAAKRPGGQLVNVSDFKASWNYVALPDKGAPAHAVITFTMDEKVKRGSLYQTMSVTQALEAVLADEQADGLVLNPAAGRSMGYLHKREIPEVLKELPRQQPKPFSLNLAK